MTTSLTYSQNTVSHPLIVATLHSNSTVNETGTSDNIFIGGAKHVDVLISLGKETGTATIQYHVNVIESGSGSTIRTYDGASLTSATIDYITIDSLTLGDYINITWTGTLTAEHYFTGVYCKVIAK